MSMYTAVSDLDYYGEQYDERDSDDDTTPGPLAISDTEALDLSETLNLCPGAIVEGDFSFEQLDGAVATMLWPERRIIATTASAYGRDWHVKALGGVIQPLIVDNDTPF